MALSLEKAHIPIKKTSTRWGKIQELPAKIQRLPSGKLTVCYWKLPFIVDLPIKNGDFP